MILSDCTKFHNRKMIVAFHPHDHYHLDMLFAHLPILMRGGGDLASGVAYRLHKAGFPIVVLELPQPLVVRRRVALATAVLEGEVNIEGLHARRVATLAEAWTMAQSGEIPVLVSPELPSSPLTSPDSRPDQIQGALTPAPILIDARMAKYNIDTELDQAALVIALGPGFTAGVDCHAVVETKRGHYLGRVIWDGRALPNTGRPGNIAGKSSERVLRSPISGAVVWYLAIGDRVKEGQLIGSVAGKPIVAPFDGVIRGLIAPGIIIPAGSKIGDVDPRANVEACFTISDKALSIGGGVLEAILSWANDQPQHSFDGNES
jgi:xanthine dehydrogenase accessory factor